VTAKDAYGYTAGDYALYFGKLDTIKIYIDHYNAATANQKGAPPALNIDLLKRRIGKFVRQKQKPSAAKQTKKKDDKPATAIAALRQFIAAKVDIFSILDTNGAHILMNMCQSKDSSIGPTIASIIEAMSGSFKDSKLQKIINTQDKNGNTMLHFVTRHCRTDPTWLSTLTALSRYADPTIANKAGLTPAQEYTAPGSALAWLISNGKSSIDPNASSAAAAAAAAAAPTVEAELAVEPSPNPRDSIVKLSFKELNPRIYRIVIQRIKPAPSPAKKEEKKKATPKKREASESSSSSDDESATYSDYSGSESEDESSEDESSSSSSSDSGDEYSS